ncbi:MAG: 30S ribosomal protein S16 [Spirochaetales bacterium]
MSVSIRLKRFGAKKRPYYRIVVTNSTAPRDGKTIEEVGYYHPVEKEGQVSFKADRIREWLSKGAQLSPTVKSLLNKSQFFLS